MFVGEELGHSEAVDHERLSSLVRRPGGVEHLQPVGLRVVGGVGVAAQGHVGVGGVGGLRVVRGRQVVVLPVDGHGRRGHPLHRPLGAGEGRLSAGHLIEERRKKRKKYCF